MDGKLWAITPAAGVVSDSQNTTSFEGLRGFSDYAFNPLARLAELICSEIFMHHFPWSHGMLNNLKIRPVKSILAVIGLMSCALPIHGQVNQETYSSSELYKTVGKYENKAGDAQNTDPLVYKGHVIVPYGGPLFKGKGGVKTWDFQIRVPKLVGTTTHNSRRNVGWSMSTDGILVNSMKTGIAVADVSDPKNPKTLATLDIPGIKDEYEKAPFALWYYPPYLYMGGNRLGLHVIDMKDPYNPQYIGKKFNGTVGVLQVVGDMMVAVGVDTSNFYTFDLSDPENPSLLASRSNYNTYGLQVNGNKAYVCGKKKGAIVWDLTNPANPKDLWTVNAQVGGSGSIDCRYIAMKDDTIHVSLGKAGYNIISIPEQAVIAKGAFKDNHNHWTIGVLGNLTMVASRAQHQTYLFPFH